MSPTQLEETLSAILSAKLQRAVMIWGPPGIGKSSIVAQLAPRSSAALDTEIARIIGNARFEHNVCLMARNQYGMGEFGTLFYLISDL